MADQALFILFTGCADFYRQRARRMDSAVERCRNAAAFCAIRALWRATGHASGPRAIQLDGVKAYHVFLDAPGWHLVAAIPNAVLSRRAWAPIWRLLPFTLFGIAL